MKLAGCSDVSLSPTKLHDVIRGHRYENLKSQTFLCLFFEISRQIEIWGVRVYFHADISRADLILIHIVQT
jgi:hypothetical protein